MPQIAIKVETSLVSQRTLNRIARDSMRATLDQHAQRHLPRHFARGAATRYGYLRRSSKYVRQVKKRYPQWRPLYRTGRLRTHILDAAHRTVTATPKRGRLRLRAYFPLNADRKRELTAITRDEVLALAEFRRDYVVREINNPANQKRRRSQTVARL